MKCLYCYGPLTVSATLQENNVAKFILEKDYGCSSVSVITSTLHSKLLSYWRWCAEGKSENQHYYDDYRDHIEWVGPHYKFSIQLSDSPEGDTWVRGTFTYLAGCVKIDNMEYSSS